MGQPQALHFADDNFGAKECGVSTMAHSDGDEARGHIDEGLGKQLADFRTSSTGR